MTSGVRAYGFFFLFFLLVLLAGHVLVLDLPYFWDELGQFIPSALDIYRDGYWVARSTLPNVHPPGVMAYLAGVWQMTGYSIPATRVAMLVLAAAGVLGTFVLAIELCRPLPGVPAFLAAGLLLASPLFWAQSAMAQLDMPAMVFTVWALALFLKGKYAACAAICTALVLVKETSIVVPAVLGAILLYERRVSQAMLFFAPAAALSLWLLCLYRTTGHVFGNAEFTHYNITFQLHPVRLLLTVLRRLFYLFVDNLHIVGTAAIVFALRKSTMFRSRAWAIVGVVALLQTLAVSVLGGAALERYLMPVLPLFYVAVAAALTAVSKRTRHMASAGLFVGLVAGILYSSPLAYPFENNSAFVTFVRLQQRAAQLIETDYPRSIVASAWPFPDALRRPEFGYVARAVPVRGLDNFNRETVLAQAGKFDVLVLYSRTWEPRWGALQLNSVRRFLEQYYFYQPQITSAEVQELLGFSPVARWEERDQWIEVYVRSRQIVR